MRGLGAAAVERQQANTLPQDVQQQYEPAFLMGRVGGPE
jgi:hypothetical protein